MKKSSNSPEKLDRKIVERNRRIHMKGLCFKLASIIPSQHFRPPREMLSQQDQIDQATNYIRQLGQKVEKLKQKKLSMSNNETSHNANNETSIGSILPVVELRDFDSSIEVVLISGLNKNIMLHEAIAVLQDEGAEVVSASFWIVGDKVLHTLHAQVKVSRVGVDTLSVYQRLQELIRS